MALIAVILIIGIAVVVLDQGGLTGSGSSGAGGGSSPLSSGDIAGFASNAGFTGPDLQVAAAVALAESSGDPNARGDPTLGVSVGLWQVNLKAHPNYTQAQLLDPQTNA